MHEPLTVAEYKAIAAELQFPTNAFIDGAFRPANSGKTFTSTNPATGEVLAEIA
ncbi:aldehyde dehydrogenase, partial [Rhizobium ruizarguesonis]